MPVAPAELVPLVPALATVLQLKMPPLVPPSAHAVLVLLVRTLLTIIPLKVGHCASRSCPMSRVALDNVPGIFVHCTDETIPTDACTCEKAVDGGLLPTETDFTTKA